MRIAMVSEHASPLAALGGVDAGGQNVHVAALALGLAARGHRVRVYTRRDAADLPERVALGPRAEVVHVPAGPAEHIAKDDLLPYMAGFGRWMADSWLQDGVPDLVHSHFWMSGIAALEAADAVPVPLVHTFHALGTVKRRHQHDRDTSPAERRDAEPQIGRSVDRVIATCTDEVEELRRMGVPADAVRVVPCGVDTTLFSPRARTDTPAQGGSAGTVLCVGRLVERKGVDTVIEAVAALAGVRLLIAGGPEKSLLGTDPEAQRLITLATEHGMTDRIELLGSVGHEQMPALIRASDLVVCTPWYEPFGIVPIEAAACGTAVVGSAVGGLLDTIVDGRTGTLVPPRDPAATARAIGDLLADPDRRAGYGRAARMRALSLYDWASVSAATDRVYRSVVAADHRSEVSA
ncbi:glycosyltransferase [Nakamurella sp. GG22]